MVESRAVVQRQPLHRPRVLAVNAEVAVDVLDAGGRRVVDRDLHRKVVHAGDDAVERDQRVDVGARCERPRVLAPAVGHAELHRVRAGDVARRRHRAVILGRALVLGDHVAAAAGQQAGRAVEVWQRARGGDRRAVLFVGLGVVGEAGLEQQLAGVCARPPDLRDPAAAERIGRCFRCRDRIGIETVEELAVELLLDIQANLVFARCGNGDPADAAVVAHVIPIRRAPVRELRGGDIDFLVLVLVGEVEPDLVLGDRTTERRVDLVVVRSPCERQARCLDRVRPVVRLQ